MRRVWIFSGSILNEFELSFSSLEMGFELQCMTNEKLTDFETWKFSISG